MTPEPTPREESLERVKQYVEGKLEAADLAHDLDDVLSGLNLYPPDEILDLGQAAGQILERQPEAAVTAVLQLASSMSRETRALACSVIARLARYSPAVWGGIVRHLATDADWEVRSFAARVYDSRSGYTGAAELHSEWVFDEIAAWVKDNNYLLRHAACQALLGYVQLHVEKISSVLKMLEPLLNDTTEYVRRGLVMALRTMGRMQPSAVLDFAESHLPAGSPDSREALELVLSDRFADRQPDRKAALMARLRS